MHGEFVEMHGYTAQSKHHKFWRKFENNEILSDFVKYMPRRKISLVEDDNYFPGTIFASPQRLV